MNWTTLVDATTLRAQLGDPQLRLLDARFVLTDPVAGASAYAQSHLPGAPHADLNGDLADLSGPGEGRHPLPDAAQFAARLGAWGIAPAHQVVVYDAGDGSMAAARLWWMLKLLGHQRVAVLDGGLAGWRAISGEESAAPAQVQALPPYPASFDSTRIVDSSQVQARLGEAPGWLIDARAPERFSGQAEHVDTVAGHVPGAVNHPYARNLRDGAFKPPAELRALLQPLLAARAPAEVVLMCGSGVTACHLLLAFEHAGLPGPRVYAGSWSGWISDPTRPVAVSAS
jgi:thiosulfate/3-mercaptopyruvate sulfurtransferase